VGQDYKELDAQAKATFQLNVLSADDDRATVRVRYQPDPAPVPAWPNGPDPSIRPWPPVGDDYWSPDIQIENALVKVFQARVPWAGHDNTIVATVTNSGNMDARNVRVGFWIRDFTISNSGPETFLGWVTHDLGAGKSSKFSMKWVPPATVSNPPNAIFGSAHYCVVVRISPYVDPLNSAIHEINPDNNMAQSNYTVLYSLASSPFSRVRVPVAVTNPYTDRPVSAMIHAEQRLPWFRSYLEHTRMALAAGETRSFDMMVECIADLPVFRDVARERVWREPNITSIIAFLPPSSDSDTIQVCGRASVEVWARRKVELFALDFSRRGGSGRVRFVDTGAAPAFVGKMFVAARDEVNGRDLIVAGQVDAAGAFAVSTPDFTPLPGPFRIEVYYSGGEDAGPASAEVAVG
jgi:CARDB